MGGQYLVARPERYGISDAIRSIIRPRNSKTTHHLECPEDMRSQLEDSWKLTLSFILLKILKSIASPLATLGFCIEFILNLFSQNGGVLTTLRKILKGRIVIPKKGTETFRSLIGHMDNRLELHHMNARDNINLEAGSKFCADVCAMASKLAYENEFVIRSAVTKHWEMHFVEFFNFWNDRLQRRSTQAFILCDKEADAELVVVAFRGTEPFNADDWSTDFDISWHQLGQVGKVHLGFLEALGMANRNSTKFQEIGCNDKYTDSLNEDPEKPLAYYTILKKLKELLRQHKNAKFIVTGHSLGGALAALFAGLLLVQKEDGLLEKLLAVYTFGQPRIGDGVFAKFVNENLNKPKPRYFRIVYSNDLVPRVPFDDPIFNFKHFGVCLYYNSCYREQNLWEEPNRNFSAIYFIPVRITAAWELARGFMMAYFVKGNDVKETGLSAMSRVFGLVVPGVSAHSTVNYVNAVRLGPSILRPVLDHGRSDPTKARHDWTEDVKLTDYPLSKSSVPFEFKIN